MGGGATILLFFVILLNVRAIGQSTCPIDRFEFEIEKVVPSAPWRVNSTTNNPGAFHCYYRVNLKTRPGQPPFPANFFFNFLRFNGTIQIDNFTSRIDVQKTIEFSPVYYRQFLDTSPLSLSNGEISWTLGSAGNCEPGTGVTLILPMGATSVTLFTICVEAVPGDLIKWTSFSAHTDQCNPPGTTCDGPMVVSAVGNSTTIIFPLPSPTIPNLKEVAYEYNFNLQFLQSRVYVEILPPQALSGYYRKVDGVIHIEPSMTASSFDLFPSSISSFGGPTMTRLDTRKNSDGSYDIYFVFENFSDPDDPPLDVAQKLLIFVIDLEGFNLSQGGELHCSMTAGRWVSGPNGNNVTYQLFSNPTVVNIPGHEPCSNDLRVTGSTFFDQDCSGGVRFTINHNNPTPMSLQYLRLEFFYKAGGGGSASPGIPVSDLPDAANSGVLIPVTSKAWFYVYEKQGTFFNPSLIEDGMYIDVPFSLFFNCVTFNVALAEADPTPGANNGNSYCALGVEGEGELCDAKVSGSVFLPNHSEAPYSWVSLKDTDSPYSLDDFEFCEPTFNFCPDQSQAPFFLEVKTHPTYQNNYLCIDVGNNGNLLNVGVTTYDLVLIDQHLRGTKPFTNVYQWIAANVSDDENFFQGGDRLSRQTDIPELRKLILGIYDNTDSDPSNDWPHVTPSWYYIRETLNIPTPPSPTDVVNIMSLQGSNREDVPPNGGGGYGNFYAVKLGDINYTCNCNVLRPEAAPPIPYFQAKLAEHGRVGRMITVPVYSDAPFDLVAAQFGLRFDPTKFALADVVTNPDQPIQPYHLGMSKTAEGELRFGWSIEQDWPPISGRTLLFTLVFDLRAGVEYRGETVVWYSGNIMDGLVYTEDGTEHRAELGWSGTSRNDRPALEVVVTPNPFLEELNVYVFAEREGPATLTISDGRGKPIAQQTADLLPGDNALVVRPAGQLYPGVYYLNLEVDGHRYQRKVIKM